MPGPLGILGNNSGGGILSQQGGILSRFTGGAGAGGAGGGILSAGGNGILATQAGILKARIAAFKGGATLDAKLSGIGSTLGTRVRGMTAPGGGAPAPAPAQNSAEYAVGAQQQLSLVPPTSQGRFA